jgi:predicted phosphodiesterase
MPEKQTRQNPEKKSKLGWIGAHAAKSLGCAALCASAGLGATLLFAKEDAKVGPTTVELSNSLNVSGRGDTIVDLGPLGEADFPTHDGFISGNVRVKALDLNEIKKMESSDSIGSTLKKDVDNIEQSQANLLEKSALIWISVAGATAIAGACFVDRRYIPKRNTLGRWGSAFVISLAVPAGLAAHTSNTASASTIEDARYSGLIAEVPQLTSSAEELSGNIDQYNQQIAEAVNLASSLTNDFESMELLPEDDGLASFLVVADIGSDLGSMKVITDLSEWIEPDAVLNITDQTEYGTEIEASMYDQLGDIDSPHILTRGNHDSQESTARIAENDNVIVLDSSSVEVEGIKIFGIADPRFTVGQNRSLETDQQGVQDGDREIMTKLGQDTLKSIAGEDIDILLMPDRNSAEVVNGKVRITMFGHTHRQTEIFDANGNTFLNPGTMGGESVRPKDENTPERTAVVVYIDKETKQVKYMVRLNFGKSGEFKLSIEQCQVQPTENEAGDKILACI